MIRLVLMRFSETYFRHRWLYLLPFALMVALAGVYQIVTPPVYVADGTMYVQKQSLITSLTSQSGGFSWVTPAAATVAELNELLRTDAFARAVIGKTPLESQMNGGSERMYETITEFRKAVTFEALGDNLVMVTAKHKDPQVAQQAVSAILDSYVLWKLNADNQDSIVAQDFFGKILAPYQADLEKARATLRSYLLAHPDPVRGDRPLAEQLQIQELQTAVADAQARVKDATEKMENARLAQSKAESELRQSYAVVDAPALPLKPTKTMSDRAKESAIFVAAGFLLSLFGVIGGVLLDRTVRLALDARLQLRVPLLALVPDTAAAVRRMRARLPQIVDADASGLDVLLHSPIVAVPREAERELGGYPAAPSDERAPRALPDALARIGPTLVASAVIETLTPNGADEDQHTINGNGASHGMQKLSLRSADDAAIDEVQRRYDASSDPTERLHYQIVMLAHRGRTPAQIADTVFYSREAIEYILRQFMTGGVDAIPLTLPTGSGTVALPAWEAELLRVINSTPRSQGVDSERWTTKRLADYLAFAVQVRIRPETISLCLHRHGYVCRNRIWRREQQVEQPVILVDAPKYRALGSPDDMLIDN